MLSASAASLFFFKRIVSACSPDIGASARDVMFACWTAENAFVLIDLPCWKEDVPGWDGLPAFGAWGVATTLVTRFGSLNIKEVESGVACPAGAKDYLQNMRHTLHPCKNLYIAKLIWLKSCFHT